MAETIAATVVATQASKEASQTAPAAEAAKADAKASLKAPLIADPEAFLARARARQGLRSVNSAAGTSNAKPDASAKPTAATPEAKTEPVAEVKAEDKPAEVKTGDDEPDVPSLVAQLSREKRELAKQRTEIEKEKAAAKAEREQLLKEQSEKLSKADSLTKAVEALGGGEILTALKMMNPDVNPSAIALQLLEQLQKEDERTISPAEVDRMLTERLKADEDRRKKEAEAQRKEEEEKRKAADMATLEGARDKYMEACSMVFSKEKFPFIAAHGIERSAVTAFVESRIDEDTGRMMPTSPEETLKHFEELYRKRAEAAGWAPKATEAAKPAPSPSLSPSSLVADSGGKIPQGEKRQTLDERRAAFKARARMIVAQ